MPPPALSSLPSVSDEQAGRERLARRLAVVPAVFLLAAVVLIFTQPHVTRVASVCLLIAPALQLAILALLRPWNSRRPSWLRKRSV